MTGSLTARNLQVRIGDVTILDRISFGVHTGELCALIGPSGAGKSTLINTLHRLDPAEGSHKPEYCF